MEKGLWCSISRWLPRGFGVTQLFWNTLAKMLVSEDQSAGPMKVEEGDAVL
jgi:hypothetical protein